MAFDMLLKLGKIEGESKIKDFAGHIDVLAWSWGASNSGSFHVGSGGGAGKANFQDLSLTKWVDKSSPDILKFVSIGEHVKTAKLIVRKAGGAAGKQLPYLEIDMKDIYITSLSTGGSGGEDRLTENISLNFAEFKVTYTEQLETGAKGKDPSFGYNIAEASEKS